MKEGVRKGEGYYSEGDPQSGPGWGKGACCHVAAAMYEKGVQEDKGIWICHLNNEKIYSLSRSESGSPVFEKESSGCYISKRLIRHLNKGYRCTQLVEHLPRMLEALSLVTNVPLTK